jgi:hypothetical protein
VRFGRRASENAALRTKGDRRRRTHRVKVNAPVFRFRAGQQPGQVRNPPVGKRLVKYILAQSVNINDKQPLGCSHTWMIPKKSISP